MQLKQKIIREVKQAFDFQCYPIIFGWFAIDEVESDHGADYGAKKKPFGHAKWSNPISPPASADWTLMQLGGIGS